MVLPTHAGYQTKSCLRDRAKPRPLDPFSIQDHRHVKLLVTGEPCIMKIRSWLKSSRGDGYEVSGGYKFAVLLRHS